MCALAHARNRHGYENDPPRFVLANTPFGGSCHAGAQCWSGALIVTVVTLPSGETLTETPARADDDAPHACV
jgi:hypothetical protein